MNSPYSILDASLTSGDITLDIRSSIIEFQTFEHIGKPYVDATLAFVDDFGLINALSIKGTEIFTITMGDVSSDSTAAFTKYFFVSKIIDTHKVNERSEMVSVQLVEDTVYVDAVKQISKSYRGTIEDMISTIASNELNKTVVYDEEFEGSAQGPRNIVVPYMSPLQAIQWVKDRATSKTGAPIYLRASLYTDDLILSDFDSHMKRDPFNKKLPLRYTSAISSVDDIDVDKTSYYSIKAYSNASSNNMLRQYEMGNVGSYYNNLDAGTGFSSGEHVSIRDIVDEFYLTELISYDTVQTMFDPELLIGDKLSDEYNSLNVFQITSSNTYNQYASYHDETVVVDDNNNISESKLKIKNKIIRAMLKKNMMDIGIDGRTIFGNQVTTGDKVRAIFLSSDVSADNKDEIDQIDRSKSGDYFILAINHIFKPLDESHVVQLRMTKIGELSPMDIEI